MTTEARQTVREDTALSRACPICGGTAERLFQKHGYWIVQCSRCTHRFAELDTDLTHVQQVYDNSYFEGGAAGYTDYLSEADLLIAHGARYGRILQRYMTPGRLLDVGAAAGFILKGLEGSGWQGVGLEPNARMVDHARQQLGLNAVVGTLEDFQSEQPFKLITMVQVIAHFYDVRRALAAAAALTEPGGYWLIESWNKDSLMARMLGSNWHEYSPPSVLHWFSPQTLRQLVAQFGFQEVARSRPAKKLNGGHAKSLLRYKLGEQSLVGKALNLLPDTLTIPYPNFDLFWGLYQKPSKPEDRTEF